MKADWVGKILALVAAGVCPVSLIFAISLRVILVQTDARRRVIAVAMARRSNEGLGKKGRSKMAKISETGH